MIEKLKEYRDSVSNLADNKSDLVFNNKDRFHANIVLTTMFEKAVDNICIYDDDLSGDIADVDHKLIDSLVNFVEKNSNTTLNVYIKNDSHNSNLKIALQKLLIDRPKQVVINKVDPALSAKLYTDYSIVNFAVADGRMFRLEYPNESSRSAICSFNNPSVGRLLMNLIK